MLSPRVDFISGSHKMVCAAGAVGEDGGARGGTGTEKDRNNRREEEEWRGQKAVKP